jgi:hypothetical protein
MSVFNPQGWDLAGVRFLFICCSMAAMGVVMVFERDALFPDKLDYQVRRDSAVGLLPHQLDDASRSSSERLVPQRIPLGLRPSSAGKRKRPSNFRRVQGGMKQLEGTRLIRAVG